MLELDCLCLDEQFVKARLCVVKDQSLQERFPGGGAEEGMVSVFGYIDTRDQILL